MQRRKAELNLVGHWVKAVNPPEPDPLWFSGKLKNEVDNSSHGPDN